MEKLLEVVRKRKWEMLIYWIIVFILLYAFFAKIVLTIEISKIHILFVVGISIILYTALVLTLEYKSSQKKLSWVNSIYDEFAHMQIFLDNNNLILEILEGELNKLEQLASVKSFKIERISDKNDLVKVLVK